MPGLVSVKSLHVRLQTAQVTELLGAVCAAEGL